MPPPSIQTPKDRPLGPHCADYKADPIVTPTGGPPPLTFYPDLGWTCGKWQNMVKSTYLHGADLAQSKKWKGKILFIFYLAFRENRRVVKSPRFWSPLV